MICQSQYDSFEAIPEALRDEFEQVNGKWQLKLSAIPGVGPLFNAALEANRNRALEQLNAQKTKTRSLEEEVSSLKDKLAILDTPGNKVLSKEDADTFDAYISLGTPKELKDRLDKLPGLEEKVQKFETSEALIAVTKANGLGDLKLNSDVLTDWLSSSEGKGITAFVKTEERTDAKGVKTSVEVPYLRIEEADGSSIKVSEAPLLSYAKEKLPEWKYNALVAGEGKAPAAPRTPGVVDGNRHQVPDLGSSRTEPTKGENKRPVDKFNEARSSRPNPFAPKTVQNGGGMPQVR